MPNDPALQGQRDQAGSVSEIDALVDRLARLAESPATVSEFYEDLLAELLDGAAALGAAVWNAGGSAVTLAARRGAAAPEKSREHLAVLGEAIADGQTRTLREIQPEGGPANVILSPFRADDRTAGVLEVRHDADISRAALAGQARLAQIAADLIALFHRNRRLRALEQRERTWQEIDRFARAIHHHAELEPTACQIANEGRRLIDCHRLTVLIRRRNRWRVVAVSGADSPHRRAAAVARLEHVAAAAARQDHPTWYDEAGTAASLPPEVEEPLQDYVDQSGVRVAGFLPLTRVDETAAADGAAFDVEPPRGMLVVEQFDNRLPDAFREKVEAVRRHAAGAIERALAMEELPLYPASRLLARSGRIGRLLRQPAALLAAAAVVCVPAVLALIPAELRVEARGVLQPERRRHVFAPADGIVETLAVDRVGQEVAAGRELVGLGSPELEYDIQQVAGELETSRKRLASIEAERLRTDRASREDLRASGLRSAEEEALRKQVEGLERQRAILEGRRDRLRITSPIDGRLLTWDPERLLLSRPVARGQLLLTVADLEGTWIVELAIADDRIGRVMGAAKEREEPLPVRFLLLAEPERRYAGVLERISPASEADGKGTPTVRAVVRPDDQAAMRRLHPGATVVARIDCGRRSALTVLLDGILHALRSHLFF